MGSSSEKENFFKMNKKQFIILAILTFLSVIAAVITLTTGKGRFSPGRVFFSGGGIPPFDVNAVTCINLENSRGRLKIEKKNGMWIIPSRADYPANTLFVSSFVNAIREVKCIKKLESDKKYWRNYGVDISSGNRETLTVNLSDSNGKAVASVIMGNLYYPPEQRAAAQQPAGRYLLSNTPGALPFLAGISFAEATTDPGLWLDRDFLKFPEQSLLSIKSIGPSGKTNWELRKSPGKNDYSFVNLPKGKAISIDKIHKYIRKLSEISFEDVTPGKDQALTENCVLLIESGGAIYEIKTGVKKEKYLMTVTKKNTQGKTELPTFFSKWTYKISPVQADALNAPLSYFSPQ